MLSYPQSGAKVSLRPPIPPINPKIPLIIAIKATKTKSIAPTLRASFNPSVVPLASASRAFDPTDWSEISIFSSTDAVWGKMSFAMIIAPGAAITEAAMRWRAKDKRISGSDPPKKPT